MHTHGSLKRYWSSSRSCHDVIVSGLILISEWRLSFIFWKKMLESYTANRRVTDVKYFHNYTNTYPIVPWLLVLSLLRPHKQCSKRPERQLFFYCTYGHLNEPQAGNVIRPRINCVINGWRLYVWRCSEDVCCQLRLSCVNLSGLLSKMWSNLTVLQPNAVFKLVDITTVFFLTIKQPNMVISKLLNLMKSMH
jgi:hypothetical protein